MTRQDLTEQAEPFGSPLAEDVPRTLAVRPLFWRARYVRPSDWVVHIPFAFWLTEAMRPRRIVELGLGSGTSYFAFCQAVDKLGLSTRCLAVDHWQGDAQGKVDETTLQSVNWYNETQFQEFSRIAVEDVVGAERHVPAGSVDILHVDLELTRAVIDSLTHEWAATLSDRAVVLIHAPERQAAASKDAAKFLDRLRQRYRTFEMPQGQGLLVVLFGGQQAEKVLRLATLAPESPEYGRVHETFQRLGDGYRNQVEAREESRKASKLRRDLQVAKSGETAAEAARAKLAEEVATLSAALEARRRKAAEAEARLLDRDREREALTTLAEDRAARIAQLEAELSELRARDDDMAEALQREIAGLTERLAAAEASARETAEALAADVARAADARAAAEAEAGAARAAQDALAAERDALRQETEAANARADRAEAGRQAEAARITALEAAAMQARQDADRARQELRRLRDEADHVQGDALEALRGTLAEAEAQAGAREAEISVLQAQLSDRFDELGQLQRTMEEERKVSAETEARLHAAENALALSHARQAETEAELKAARQALSEAEAKAEEAKGQSKAAWAKARSRAEALKAAEAARDAARRETAAAKAALAKANDAADQAEEARKALSDRLTVAGAAAQRAAAEATRRISTLEEERAALLAEMAAAPRPAPAPDAPPTPPTKPLAEKENSKGWRGRIFGDKAR